MLDPHLETEKKITKDVREKIEFTNKNQQHTTEHLFTDILVRQQELAQI